jgi:hypothetical protein
MVMKEQVTTDESPKLGRQFTVRRWLLEALGFSLIVVALTTDETILQALSAQQDPTLPHARPFLLLIGLLVFAAGLALESVVDRRQSS